MQKNKQKIPEGWSVTFLENLTKHIKYGIVDGPFGSNLKSEHYRLTGIPVIQSGFVTSQKFMANNYLYVDKALFEREKRSATHAGDIIMAKIGAQAGTCALLPKGHPEAILAGNCLKITINSILANNTYILEILHRKYEKDGFIDIKSVTAQPAISLTHLKKLKILLPPLPEQEKIAEILSCWDDGIEKLSALIEKKKIQKKALMQQLLTGKHRLKGFSTPWHEVKFGDIGTTYTGLNGKNKEDFGNGKPYIPYLNIYQNFIIDINQFELVAINDGENQNTVKFGDIFFTTSSETPDEVGISSVLLEKLETETYLNSFCFGFRLHNFSTLLPFYAAYLCRSEQIRKIMYTLAQGATRFNLSKMEFLKSYIFIPSDLAEQKTIAEILSKADEEIELLNKKLEAFKLEKKALMQQLLTGKIRVKVN